MLSRINAVSIFWRELNIPLHKFLATTLQTFYSRRTDGSTSLTLPKKKQDTRAILLLHPINFTATLKLFIRRIKLLPVSMLPAVNLRRVFMMLLCPALPLRLASLSGLAVSPFQLGIRPHLP